MWELTSDVRLLISKAFNENGIEFAVPIYRVDEYGHYYHETKRSGKDDKGNPKINDSLHKTIRE